MIQNLIRLISILRFLTFKRNKKKVIKLYKFQYIIRDFMMFKKKVQVYKVLFLDKAHVLEVRQYNYGVRLEPSHALNSAFKTTGTRVLPKK